MFTYNIKPSLFIIQVKVRIVIIFIKLTFDLQHYYFNYNQIPIKDSSKLI